jgi:8-oxo-dGTP pyrophosphatase MutT (NUDIX family)
MIARLRDRLRDGKPQKVALEGFRLAAVLVPIVIRSERPTLLLTERTADLPSHAGQVAFPGGKLDTADADLESCAIREAAEELGLEPAAIEVLGCLDDVPTPTRFVITPVVALLTHEPHLRPNPREVASWFYAPIDGLPSMLEEHGMREFMGVSYPMLAYRVGEHMIWGATARMVKQLLDLSEQSDSESPDRAL